MDMEGTAFHLRPGEVRVSFTGTRKGAFLMRSKREGGQKGEGTGEREAPSLVWASCLTGPLRQSTEKRHCDELGFQMTKGTNTV